MSDEQRIRDLIERWAAAVHAGDLPTVLGDHAPDIVMFDVPPPEPRCPRPGRLSRDLAGFLRVAGLRRGVRDRVARCHWTAPTSRSPTRCCDAARPRILIATPSAGYGSPSGCERWTTGGWSHTSITPSRTRPDRRTSLPPRSSVHEQWFDRTAAKDLNGLMEHIAPDIVSSEHAGPLQYVGIHEVREVCRRGLESASGQIEFRHSRPHRPRPRRSRRGLETRPHHSRRCRIPIARHPGIREARRRLAHDPPALLRPRLRRPRSSKPVVAADPPSLIVGNPVRRSASGMGLRGTSDGIPVGRPRRTAGATVPRAGGQRGGNCEFGTGFARLAVGAFAVYPITAQLMLTPTEP